MEISKNVIYIYALRDPITKITRYIGKTNDLYKRYHEHNTRKGITKKDKWIAKLKDEGEIPIFEILEECNEDNWHIKEREYIKKYRTKQNKLLNSHKGIKNRTDSYEREKIKDILLFSKFYFYQNPITQEKELILNSQNGIYWKVYGSRQRNPLNYYFIYSKNKKYCIPKSSSIYRKNLKSLKVITEHININHGYHKDIIEFNNE